LNPLADTEWHSRGRRFDSVWVHHFKNDELRICGVSLFGGNREITPYGLGKLDRPWILWSAARLQIILKLRIFSLQVKVK
jgi:hypothetical protein